MSEPPDFRTFVEARWTALVHYAYALTGDRGHAEDVVQHALEKCWCRWRHVSKNGAEAYVRTAIARVVVSRWRRRRFAETSLDNAPPPVTSGPENSVALHDALWRGLAGLPPRMRAVVVLRFVEDLTEAQTAAVLDCSVGTVKSQTSRALARLRLDPHLEHLGLPTRTPETSGASRAPARDLQPVDHHLHDDRRVSGRERLVGERLVGERLGGERLGGERLGGGGSLVEDDPLLRRGAGPRGGHAGSGVPLRVISSNGAVRGGRA